MNSHLFTENFSPTSYWLAGAQHPPRNPAASAAAMPKKQIDVLVVGSGYTGLNTAIQTARAGRSTLVIDAADIGHGCSTRNGGQISTSIKPSASMLARKHGKHIAQAMHDEGRNALDWIAAFIEAENIDCNFKRHGHFHAAHTRAHFEQLARKTELLKKNDQLLAHIVSPEEQRNELGTDSYHGGVVYPDHAGLHPARYHTGLVGLATEAGADLIARCEATAYNKTSNGYTVQTSRGPVSCRELVIATNGYTGSLMPWLQRRVIPIGSYIIATEAIAQERIDELFPTDRMVTDTCKVVYYYRASPDRRRVLFGGRVSSRESTAASSAPILHQDMLRIFPQLEGTRIDNAWSGTVAYSFDEMAHTGTHDGVHYAMSYCGSGVSMASYLGMRMGQRIAGNPEGQTPLAEAPFPTRPFYTGKPWFLPPMVAFYRWRDRQQYGRSH